MSDLDKEELEATKKYADSAEKTADEMFEELGYEIYFKNSIDMRYSNNSNETIAFYGAVKTFEKSIYPVNMQELQAINKKCEELRMDLKKELEKNKDEFDIIFKDTLIFIFTIITIPIFVILQVILLIPIKIIYWIVRRFR